MLLVKLDAIQKAAYLKPRDSMQQDSCDAEFVVRFCTVMPENSFAKR